MREGPRWLYWVRILSAIGFGWIGGGFFGAWAYSELRTWDSNYLDVRLPMLTFASLGLLFSFRSAHALWKSARPGAQPSHRLRGWITATAVFHALFFGLMTLAVWEGPPVLQRFYALLSVQVFIICFLALISVHLPWSPLIGGKKRGDLEIAQDFGFEQEKLQRQHIP